MRESEAECNYEITATLDLSHFLIAQGFNFVRGRPRNSVTLAQLPRVIGAPGIDLAGASEDSHETRTAQLKVYHFKFVNTLYSVWSVKLAERAGPP
jgi:hypothetical protein